MNYAILIVLQGNYNKKQHNLKKKGSRLLLVPCAVYSIQFYTFFIIIVSVLVRRAEQQMHNGRFCVFFLFVLYKSFIHLLYIPTINLGFQEHRIDSKCR